MFLISENMLQITFFGFWAFWLFLLYLLYRIVAPTLPKSRQTSTQLSIQVLKIAGTFSMLTTIALLSIRFNRLLSSLNDVNSVIQTPAYWLISVSLITMFLLWVLHGQLNAPIAYFQVLGTSSKNYSQRQCIHCSGNVNTKIAFQFAILGTIVFIWLFLLNACGNLIDTILNYPCIFSTIPLLTCFCLDEDVRREVLLFVRFILEFYFHTILFVSILVLAELSELGLAWIVWNYNLITESGFNFPVEAKLNLNVFSEDCLFMKKASSGSSGTDNQIPLTANQPPKPDDLFLVSCQKEEEEKKEEKSFVYPTRSPSPRPHHEGTPTFDNPIVNQGSHYHLIQVNLPQNAESTKMWSDLQNIEYERSSKAMINGSSALAGAASLNAVQGRVITPTEAGGSLVGGVVAGEVSRMFEAFFGKKS